MDMHAHRRKRLKELIDAQADGVAARFARLHNQDPVRLRQLLNPNYRQGKGFGEGVARRLEKDLGLAPMYFELGLEEALTALDDMSAESVNKSQKHSLLGQSNSSDIRTITPLEHDSFDNNVTAAPIGLRRVPVISYVQAGMMTEVVDPFELGGEGEVILTDLELSKFAFGLIIRGQSMYPEFREGDKVIIDPAIAPHPGDFVVAKNTQEEATFKKYRPRETGANGELVFELVPLNDDFPVLHSERDHLRIVGVMVEHRKYRRR